MKVKHLIIVSLLLAILAIGAVSASEDVDNLTADDVAEDSLEEASVDEVVAADAAEDSLEVDSGDEVIGEDLDIDVSINSWEEIHYNSYDTVVYVDNYELQQVTGNLVITADGKTVYSNKVVLPADDRLSIRANEIPDLPTGKILLNATFIPQGTTQHFTDSQDVDVVWEIDVYDNWGGEWNQFDEYDSQMWPVASWDYQLKIAVPNSISSASYTFNGATNNIALTNGVGYFTIPTSTLQMKDYPLVINAGGKSRSFTLTMEPWIYAIEASTNQIAYVEAVLPSIYSGTLYLYNYDSNNGKVGSLVTQVPVTNGRASIPLSGLAKGGHDYLAKFESSNYKYNTTLTVNVFDNTANIAVSVPSEVTVGSPVTVTASGPLGYYTLYVDGVYYKDYSSRTSFTETLSNLGEGQHRINVFFSDGNGGEYGGLFFVTVKKAQSTVVKKADTIKLTLKKVNVKKSAKKLVLQATLKINGKKAKGKILKFKFNGKTYKAKTNKKGVAKVTIKKKVLKKLKVGKKVKYQVTYGKKTVKRTAKVKK